METIIAVYVHKFEVKTRDGSAAAAAATRTTRLKWIPMRDISLVHIIPYRERRLSPDTANTVALILAFLHRVPRDARPKAGTHRGEKDFGRTYTDGHIHVLLYTPQLMEEYRQREKKRKRDGHTEAREIPDRPRGDYTGIIGDPVGNLASMALLFVRREEKERIATLGRAGSAVETDNRSRFIRSENLSFVASVLRIRAGIIARNVIVIAPGFVSCASVKDTWDSPGIGDIESHDRAFHRLDF